MPLQHYTNALDLIIDSGHILGADSTFFGEGVYFTSMPPSHGKKEVAHNNWCVESNYAYGKMTGVIKIYGVKDRDDDFEEVGEVQGRDVWLYRRDELELADYKWKAFRISWKGNSLKKLTQVHDSEGDDVDEDGFGGEECDDAYD